MPLPLSPPLLPQLAKSASTLPSGEGWAYEPKWDGFRAIAFVSGDEVELQSRNGKPLTRYFPEVTFPPGRYVMDGELVAASFDTLGQRIHPAKSRGERLAAETRATFIARLTAGFEPGMLPSSPTTTLALRGWIGFAEAVSLGWTEALAARAPAPSQAQISTLLANALLEILRAASV